MHVFVAKNIPSNELLWPFSMPPKIKNEDDINLGYYHHSNIGLLKHVYRKGLKVRYGATMQCVEHQTILDKYVSHWIAFGHKEFHVLPLLLLDVVLLRFTICQYQ